MFSSCSSFLRSFFSSRVDQQESTLDQNPGRTCSSGNNGSDKWGVERWICFTVKANCHSNSVKSSLSLLQTLSLPPYPPALPKSHIWYSWKQHLTHPLPEPWHLSFIMLSPPRGRVPRLLPPRLWLTRWLWAVIAARAAREHLNELTLAVWRHLAANPLTTLLYSGLYMGRWGLEDQCDWCAALGT